jgi:hypothetical protein
MKPIYKNIIVLYEHDIMNEDNKPSNNMLNVDFMVVEC